MAFQTEKFGEEIWHNHGIYFLNAHGAAFGDVFHSTLLFDLITTSSYQTKYYHGNKLTMELIKEEHKKNVDPLNGIKNVVVITIFITTTSVLKLFMETLFQELLQKRQEIY